MSEEGTISELRAALQEEKTKNASITQANTSMFNQEQDTNLIEWQLELDNILERVEHLLRGDVLKLNKESGDMEWSTPEDDRLKLLNEYGVQLLVQFLASYLNRQIILSNFSEERIGEICKVVGDEISDQIESSFKEMGLDCPEKRKRYSAIVLQITHLVEAGYNRAYKGGERESLRSARVVTQSDSLALGRSGVGMGMGMGQKPTRKLSDPRTWF